MTSTSGGGGVVERSSTADNVAGFLAALAMLAGVLGLVWYPGRVGTAAILIALIAAGIAGAHRRLAGIALAVAGVCWLLGMVISVVADRPIF